MESSTETPRILYVAISGDDSNAGTEQAPLRSINAAAQIAMPGDTVRVHGGTYRESIHPARGGSSEEARITYEAAGGEEVNILGSEVVTGWTKIEQGRFGVWKASVSNEIFGDFNPFAELIAGDWFLNMGRPHHTGNVYFDGRELLEATAWENLQASFWYAEVGEKETTFYVNCWHSDPNEATIEINVRPTVFYPMETGINYITVRGFTMRHAATNWAPPTSEQIGLIGTNWSKGWIIENNTITHSRCVAVTLGKHGDEYDNTSENSAEGYVETIKRGLAQGWSRENIGGHIVRNNEIANCEQAGIVGSLGAIFSEVSGNLIHDIHIHRLFGGAEQAGIKFHAPIDTLIADNHIYRCNRAMWMDWMTQGTRITRNLCHDNIEQDIFVEVNHGPFVVDNNLLLSNMSIWTMSQGGAFLHNLIGGTISRHAELGRETPYHPQSSVELAGITNIRGGDERFMNNLFLDASGLEAVSGLLDVIRGDGKSPQEPEAHESFPNLVENNQIATSAFVLKQEGDEWAIQFKANDTEFIDCPVLTTDALGKAQIPDLPYMDYTGETLTMDVDFFGNARASGSNAPGPFATLPENSGRIVVSKLASSSDGVAARDLSDDNTVGS